MQKYEQIPKLNKENALAAVRCKTAFELAMKASMTGTIWEMVDLVNNGFKYGEPTFGGLQDHLKVSIQSDGLVITEKWGNFECIDAGKWTIEIGHLVIGKEGVKGYIYATGPLAYSQTPESPAECEEFEEEIEYSFEDLEVPVEINGICLQDQITEIIEKVCTEIKRQYS